MTRVVIRPRCWPLTRPVLPIFTPAFVPDSCSLVSWPLTAQDCPFHACHHWLAVWGGPSSGRVCACVCVCVRSLPSGRVLLAWKRRFCLRDALCSQLAPLPRPSRRKSRSSRAHQPQPLRRGMVLSARGGQQIHGPILAPGLCQLVAGHAPPELASHALVFCHFWGHRNLVL